MPAVIEQITAQLDSLGINLADRQKHQLGEIKVVDDNFRLNQPFVGIPSFLRSSICTDIATLWMRLRDAQKSSPLILSR
jgi:hypothetical protein